MLRKTMIVLAKAAALTGALTAEVFAHRGGRGHGGGFGDGGHIGGFGGARIGSRFSSCFAGSHFGTTLGLALFGLVFVSFASKAANDEQGRKACMYDALTVCAKFIPEREQIANCLMANRERISQSCRLLLAHAH
jgi:hypothetical protein